MCDYLKSKDKTSTTWITPQWLIDRIGISMLDPCGFLNPDGEPYVKTAISCYTLQRQQDGLAIPWYGSVFCNPPYDKNAEWLRRCWEHHRDTGEDVIVLIFARTATGYFQEFAPKATGLNFLNKRIKFLDSEGKLQGIAPVGSVLLAYGDRALNRIRNVPGFLCQILTVGICHECYHQSCPKKESSECISR
jgi:hypothetical protein